MITEARKLLALSLDRLVAGEYPIGKTPFSWNMPDSHPGPTGPTHLFGPTGSPGYTAYGYTGPTGSTAPSQPPYGYHGWTGGFE